MTLLPFMRNCLIIIATINCCAWAQQPNERQELQYEIETIQRELYCWNLLQKLRPIKIQIRYILYIAKEVKKLVAQHRQAHARYLQRFEKALLRFREEDALNRGFSPAVEREVSRLLQQKDARQEQFAAQIKTYAEKVKEILIPEQLIIIKKYQPQLFLRSELPQRGRDLAAFLAKIRQLSDVVFQRKKSKLVHKFAKRLQSIRGRKNFTVFDNQTWQRRLREIFHQVRRMSYREFQVRIDGIVDILLYDNPAREARKELHRIHQQTHGDIGNIGKFLLAPECIPYCEKYLQTVNNKE